MWYRNVFGVSSATVSPPRAAAASPVSRSDRDSSPNTKCSRVPAPQSSSRASPVSRSDQDSSPNAKCGRFPAPESSSHCPSPAARTPKKNSPLELAPRSLPVRKRLRGRFPRRHHQLAHQFSPPKELFQQALERVRLEIVPLRRNRAGGLLQRRLVHFRLHPLERGLERFDPAHRF